MDRQKSARRTRARISEFQLGRIGQGLWSQLAKVVQTTVRDGALEIAFKKSAGELGPDFLAEIRNRGGRSWRTLEIKARRRRANF